MICDYQNYVHNPSPAGHYVCSYCTWILLKKLHKTCKDIWLGSGFCKPRKDIKNHETLDEIYVSGAAKSIMNPETLVQEHTLISIDSSYSLTYIVYLEILSFKKIFFN